MPLRNLIALSAILLFSLSISCDYAGEAVPGRGDPYSGWCYDDPPPPPPRPQRDCGDIPPPGGGSAKVTRAALRPIEGCEDLLAAMKKAAIEEMRQKVLDNLNYGSCSCYYHRDYGYGYPCGGGDSGYGGASDGGGMDGSWGGGDASGSSPPPDEEGAEEYSGTNNQEAGVDEADFLKNDGRYIYLMAGNGLTIIETWPAADTHRVSSTRIEGTPQRLFVHNDRAVVYSELSRSRLKITVLNITDRHNPVLEREVFFSGQYVSSRRIGNAVYTVATFPTSKTSWVQYCPTDLWCDESFEDRWCAFYQLIQRNEEIINQARLEDWLPSITDKRYLDSGDVVIDGELMADCRNFLEPSMLGGPGLLTVASLDILDRTGPIQLTSVVGQPGIVYASMDSLYVASQHTYNYQDDWYFHDPSSNPEAMSIHKFSLCRDPIEAHYEASGVVRGRMLNQFSMGEHDGTLRTATTSGRVWDPGTDNSVFVLEQHQGVLDIIGQITGIAPTEEIRSARFVGDRGFVVTFKKTDPLYALDLTVPTAPRIAGELKIPGFSTYIHMLDHDHLLTIGFDADDQGSFAWFQGIELQIFDISDMSNPTQMHKEIIGTRGSTSEATGNHLAFNYFPPKDVLALPMVICEGTTGGSSYGTMTFNGLLVYNVTLADGFSERGRVPHGDLTNDYYGCSNWWTDPASRVKRSIIMEDFVYSISSTLLKVNHLDNLESDVAVLDLPPIP